MKKYLFSVFIFLSAGSLFAQDFDLTSDTKSFGAAGMPIILRNTGSTGSSTGQIVAFQISAFGGVSISSKAGALSLMANLMSKGTYNYSKEEIDKKLTRLGAALTIKAGTESIQITLKCLKKFLPELLPLLSEMMRVPKFEPKELELSREQLRSSLKSKLENPDAFLSLKMNQIFYKDHPYSNRPSGLLETVDSIQRGDLATALFKAFNKNNLLFTIVGDLNESEATALIEKYFAGIQKGTRANEIRFHAENDTSQIHYFPFEAPTTYFMAKFKAPSLESSDYPALTVALQILDNRLFDEVRTKRALTYSVHASIKNAKLNTGTFYVSSTKLQEAVEVIFEEVKKMQVSETSPEKIKQHVNKFLSSWYLSREARSSQAAIFSLYEIHGIGWENSNSFISRLNRVSPEDITRVMKKYVKNLTYVVVGPDKPELAPSLSRLGFFKMAPSPKKTAETAPEPEATPEDSKAETEPKPARKP